MAILVVAPSSEALEDNMASNITHSLTTWGFLYIISIMIKVRQERSELDGQVFTFHGQEGNLLNGIEVRVMSRPDGTLIDPVNNFCWNEEQFKGELARGLWTKVKLNGLTEPERALAARQLLTELEVVNATSHEVSLAETVIDEYPEFGATMLARGLIRKLSESREITGKR